MSTPAIILIVLAAIVAVAWSRDWPAVAGWGRTAARDRRRGRRLGDTAFVGVEVPAGDETSLDAMVSAWPALVRNHSTEDPLVFDYLFTGTDDGARLDVLVGASPQLLEADKRILADAFSGRATFYRPDSNPAEELAAAMLAPAEPGDDTETE